VHTYQCFSQQFQFQSQSELFSTTLVNWAVNPFLCEMYIKLYQLFGEIQIQINVKQYHTSVGQLSCKVHTALSCFNGHFPGEPWLAGFTEAKDEW